MTATSEAPTRSGQATSLMLNRALFEDRMRHRGIVGRQAQAAHIGIDRTTLFRWLRHRDGLQAVVQVSHTQAQRVANILDVPTNELWKQVDVSDLIGAGAA